MRYFNEFLRACKMTGAVVFLIVVLKVLGPLLLTGTFSVSPAGFLLSIISTMVICLVVFTAMNILDTKLRSKKNNPPQK